MKIQKTIIIAPENEGQRIDKHLSGFCTEKSRSAWKKEIEEKNVLVNGRGVKTHYILKAGDKIEFLELKPKTKEKEDRPVPNIKIIYENDDVIVLDKPAGILSHGATSSAGASVVDFLLDHFPPIKNVGDDKTRPGIVHRLDKDTSGIMIAAKNNASFKFLKDQFKKRQVQKKYTALVRGKLKPADGAINFDIRRSKSKPTMQMVLREKESSGLKSRPALTLYRTTKSFPNHTLVEAEPKTGRMHQIRVHFKAIGFPIVGDKKYGLKEQKNVTLALPRQFLHASFLEIELPGKGKRKFESKLPDDLSLFLKGITQQ